MMNYIDMHCDTLLEAYVAGAKDLFSLPGMVDFQKMRRGGALAQFFAVFMPPARIREFHPELTEFTDESYFETCVKTLRDSVATHSDIIALAQNADDILRNRAAGKMSALLTVEDGRMVQNDLARLDMLHQKGVRVIGLTWNGENCLGCPTSSDPEKMARGLTDFGKEAVEYMQQLGIVVDVSHLSDGGFRDVAALCKKPFVATHSNCRALSPHPRNLTDEMIRTVARSGGVIGINFCPEFLQPDITSKQSTVERMVAMALHMKQVGGVDVIAFGSDLDGIGGELEVGSADRMPLLIDALSAAGFTDDELEKICSGNVLRVLRDTLH